METNSKQTYFPVPLLKFSLMSICTLGLYTLYWHYKNWRYIKERDQSNIIPLGRSFFYPIWYYSLLTDISSNDKNSNNDNSIYKIVLVVAMLMITAISYLPDPFWLISILIFVPMLPAVYNISKINASREVNVKISSHRPLNFVTYLLGGALVTFTFLSAVGFFPSTMVVAGSKLWEKDLEYLHIQKILGEQENILYFYSLSSWSIREDGQFISDEYVTSYFIDPDDKSLYVSQAAYEDIEKIDVSWSTSWLEDTVVTITIAEGDAFEIWLSEESKGDRKFVNEMKRLWENKRTVL